MAASSTPMVRRFRCSTLRPVDVSYDQKGEVKSHTFTRNTNNGIGIGFHSKEFDHFLDIIELLLAADMGRLTKDGTKVQGLTHCCCVEVKILLLDVTSLALERLIPGATINQHITSHNSRGHTGSKHIQKRCFTSTRDTLRQIC